MLKKTLLCLLFTLLTASPCLAAVNYNEQFLSAVASGSVRLAEKALDNGANVNYQPPYRLTALTLAAKNKKPLLVQMLLERGADPNLAASNGYSLDTPLLYSVYNNDVQTAQLLLEKGADPSIGRILSGTVKIDVPMRRQTRPPRRSLNYETNYEISLAPEFRSQGATPLIYAIQKDGTDNPSQEMVDLLLSHGADPNQANKFGYTPLMAAAELKMFSRKFIRLEIAKQLLNSGSDPTAQDNYGNTALNYAQATNFKEMAELLAPLSK